MNKKRERELGEKIIDKELNSKSFVFITLGAFCEILFGLKQCQKFCSELVHMDQLRILKSLSVC